MLMNWRSVITFIYTFDYYNLGRYKYTFSYKCEEVERLKYGDETTKIIVNTYGTKGEASEDLKDFLNVLMESFLPRNFLINLK